MTGSRCLSSSSLTWRMHVRCLRAIVSGCLQIQEESSALLPVRSQTGVGEESKHLNWRSTIFYESLITFLELRQKRTNPHSDELAEKGGDLFSSFVLKGSEFHLHVLQISQEWGAKLLLGSPCAEVSTGNPSGCSRALCFPSAAPGPWEGAASTTGPVHKRW